MISKTIVISGENVHFVHDDNLAGLLRHNDNVNNPTPIRRASHVEPGDPSRGQRADQWYADMAPSGGPVLGPFPVRGYALTAEVAWLNRHLRHGQVDCHQSPRQ